MTKKNHHSAHILLFMYATFLNSTRPFSTHGRRSICPKAKDSKTTRNFNVLLTVQLNIFLKINQPDALNFIINLVHQVG